MVPTSWHPSVFAFIFGTLHDMHKNHYNYFCPVVTSMKKIKKTYSGITLCSIGDHTKTCDVEML